MNEELFNLFRKTNNERLLKEKYQSRSVQHLADCNVSLFNVWCRVNLKNENDFNVFKQYLESEKLNLPALLRKFIAEHYFNTKFEFNHKNNKWEEIA